jgi:hypothetical protein
MCAKIVRRQSIWYKFSQPPYATVSREHDRLGAIIPQLGIKVDNLGATSS